MAHAAFPTFRPSARIIAFPRELTRRAPVAHSVTGAGDDADHTELVTAVLLAMEDAPLTPVLCYPVRDIGRRPLVLVSIGETMARLTPQDCLIAAQALDAEQAFPGCSGVAVDLREAANIAQARRPGDVTGLLAQPRDPGGATNHRWRTGMASTVCIWGLIALAGVYALANWAIR